MLPDDVRIRRERESAWLEALRTVAPRADHVLLLVLATLLSSGTNQAALLDVAETLLVMRRACDVLGRADQAAELHAISGALLLETGPGMAGPDYTAEHDARLREVFGAVDQRILSKLWPR